MGLFGPNIKKMEAKRDIEGLVKALKNRDEDVRRLAAAALGNIGDARAVEYLIEALRNEEWSTQNTVANSLEKIGEPSVGPIIEALKDDNEDARGLFALVLGRIGGAQAIIPLADMLRDKNKIVRAEAVIALGSIKDTRIIEALPKALEDKDTYVRNRAVTVWGNITKSERAIGPLIKVLTNDHVIGSIRKRAVDALVEIGKPAVEPLLQVLRDESDYAKCYAALALSRIRDSRAVGPLIQALKDKKVVVRTAAAEALGEIGYKMAVEPLLQLLKNDKNEFVRNGTIKALGEIRDSRAVESLLKILFSSNGELGGEALLKIAPNSAISKEIMQETIYASGRYKSFWAVEKLCSIKSPVTNNLLILISKKEDVMVTDHDERGKPTEELQEFSKERQMALNELARRGSPNYDSSAFLVPSKQ